MISGETGGTLGFYGTFFITSRILWSVVLLWMIALGDIARNKQVREKFEASEKKLPELFVSDM